MDARPSVDERAKLAIDNLPHLFCGYWQKRRREGFNEYMACANCSLGEGNTTNPKCSHERDVRAPIAAAIQEAEQGNISLSAELGAARAFIFHWEWHITDRKLGGQGDAKELDRLKERFDAAHRVNEKLGHVVPTIKETKE
jgi:hypothetical protein